MKKTHRQAKRPPVASRGESPAMAREGTIPWNLQALAPAPKIFEDPQRSSDDVKAIFYEGVPWRGKPTRVFAYYGVPKTQAGQKVPAMVLVHGGGGSAFIPWVQLWVSRGYAAIAMDTCGCISGGGYENHPRHEHGGPPGWGGFDQVDQPVEEQWTYHAVADVILAHSLIRSFPQVDAERIGVTGVSWGGFLVCIVAGVDHRFKFVAPVYGCGCLEGTPLWQADFKRMGEARAQRWLRLWDPAVYLPLAQRPLLWVTGSNDFAFPLDALQKSYRLPRSPKTLCVTVRMAHAHGGPGENPREIHAMAESLFAQEAPLARIIRSGREGSEAWVLFAGQVPIVRAELNYTLDAGAWLQRNWQTTAAALDPQAQKVSAVLPDGVTAYYVNLVDTRGLVVSSEHEPGPAKPEPSFVN